MGKNLVNINGMLKRHPRTQGMEADRNEIIPFKGRTIKYDEPILLYRNLHKKGVVYSIKQNGLVVAHTTTIIMRDVEFVVNQKAKERCIKTKERNVHAFIKGYYATSGMTVTADCEKMPVRVKYNPYSKKGFVIEGGKAELKSAWYIVANKSGIGAAYVNEK